MSLQNPLFHAILNNNLTQVVKLLKKVSSNNINKNALHISLMNPAIVKLLLEKGADINAVNNRGDTPLHCAVDLGELETVCMLLYYDAEPNIPNKENITPFMKAVMNSSEKLQEVLLDYVDDFELYNTEENIVALALRHNSPYVKEIILRGGKIDHTVIENFNFLDENLDLFKFIWERIPDSEFGNDKIGPDLLYRLCQRGSASTNFGKYLDFVIDHSNESAIQGMASSLCLVPLRCFYLKCRRFNCLDQLTKFISLLLPYDFHCSPLENIIIYELFGHCDLFKILLHFSLDYSYLHNITSIVPTYLYYVKSDIKTLCNIVNHNDLKHPNSLYSLISSRAFWAHPSLVSLLNKVQKFHFPETKDIYLDLPTFPSLVELSRDKTREFILSQLPIISCSQYYTYIQHLDIPKVYKEILSFEKQIYKINL